ncbi:MAG: 50S ribosomal protein L23 [Nitrospinota bacterium]
MKTAHDIIRKPVISEKATEAKEGNKIIFKIDSRSNKSDVKKSVEEAFSVKVEKVNILNTKSKRRSLGKTSGSRPGYKKAIVTLSAGHTIEVFDQV